MTHQLDIASVQTGLVEQQSTPFAEPKQITGDVDNFARLRKATIMMVDDEPITIEVIMEFLEEADYHHFISTSDSREAYALIESERPDVILLDLMMPHVSGFDILNEMRANPKMRHIPVIVLTSSTDSETKLKALELGATDFLAKPVDSSELILRLRNTLAAKAYQDRLTYYDTLTGLPNRTMFGDHLEWSLRQAKRYNRLTALLHVNIDRFKKINDAIGPSLADEFLQAFAQRLEHTVRASDTISRDTDKHIFPGLSRLGGDEFTILLVEMPRVDCASLACQRLLDSVAAPFYIGGHEIFATCSIGAAAFPDDGADSDTLLKNVGVAMRYAKKQGGNTYRFYSSDLNERALQNLAIQSDLHRAIERNELQLFYQPQIDILSGKLVGAEALIRWQHAERGYIPPDSFIPLAEETELIVTIGEWVFNEACNHIKGWSEAGLATPKIAINVSGRQFREKTLLAMMENSIRESHIDPCFLTIELTESLLMGNALGNVQILQDMKKMGVNLSMDDFGTGYSSLSYLKRFPLDELKIDKSFMDEVNAGGENDCTAIVIAIIAMSHSLGLKVVAEGIEKPEQLEFLRQYHCDECQGYLFSKPLPASEFSELIRKSSASGGLPLSEL